MNTKSQYAKEQYEFVRSSRQVLLDYCSTIDPDDFICENSSFGRGGSNRNLLVHIANTYEFWIGKWGLKKNMVFTPYASITNMEEIKLLFASVDHLVYEFIELWANQQLVEIYFEINGAKNTVLPLKLFSHVITHEYHHKGQILSLSRHLGYVPVDTDIMRS
jgi:uncharacterized damage-inducible protein DinB